MNKNLFYAAFIPGLQDFIKQVLSDRLCDIKIHKLLDGAVLFETETTYDKLNFFCFNNIFAAVNIIEEPLAETQKQGITALENHIRLINNYKSKSNTEYKRDLESTTQCNSEVNYETIINNNRKFRTFRIIVSNENVPASINDKLRTEAEKFISGLSGLKVDRSFPDTEFWFLFRRVETRGENNFSIFMKRLTNRPSWEKTLHKGELPPPLAWTLCSLAQLKYSDSVFDPFCGYGSIPQAAVKNFHITKFTACDNSSAAADYTEKKLKNQKGFILHKCDFFDLVKDGTLKKTNIDAIITDPPWGYFEKSGGDGFLFKMFEAFNKLLKNNGKAVVLFANDEKFLKAVPVSFELQTQIPILLSGKKAVIYVLKKLLVR